MYLYQNIKILHVVLIVIISISISVLSANRSNERADRNDTNNYYQHYVCGIKASDSNVCKIEIGSSSVEIGYDYLPYLMGKTFGSDSFWYYKLVIALFVNLVVLLCVYLISGKSILPVIWLLLDYRYYAFSSNMLRHGLALAISLLAIYVFLNKNKIKSVFLSVLAMLFHVSSGSMLIKSSYKFNIKFMVVVFIVALAFTSYLSDFVLDNRELFFSLNDKSVRYIEATDGQLIRFPIQYILAFIIGLYFYKTKNDYKYTTIYNTLFLLLIVGLFISTMGLLDRITLFMTPLIYVLWFYIYLYLAVFFKGRMIYVFFFNVFFIFLLGSNFISNFYMVLIHLNAY